MKTIKNFLVAVVAFLLVFAAFTLAGFLLCGCGTTRQAQPQPQQAQPQPQQARGGAVGADPRQAFQLREEMKRQAADDPLRSRWTRTKGSGPDVVRAGAGVGLLGLVGLAIWWGRKRAN